MSEVLQALRDATAGTGYEGKLYLVGGVVRDRVMDRVRPEEDIDLVLIGDAIELADFLHEYGVTDHAPVVYPRFGTAMVSIKGRRVELVQARAESYVPESRKPEVRPATLLDDVLRRDFTINTLLENLHSGEVLDLTGKAMRDIEARLIRTPTDPFVTFDDDPLRMLRAVRFAATLGFDIEPATCKAILDRAPRLAIISKERIRDEFVKILLSEGRSQGMEMLAETGLLAQFAPELLDMRGVTQNIYHIYDVWTHTMKALEYLKDEAPLTLRLATLMHDVGKPPTRTVDEQGWVHFYGHQKVGADMARRILNRLRFPNDETSRAVKLIAMHLRVGEYDEEWTDAAVRRLIRDAGEDLEALIELTRVDKAASNTELPSVDLDELQAHIEQVKRDTAPETLKSPLTGQEIMQMLGIEPSPMVGKVKEFLVNEVIEGRIRPEDKDAAREAVIREYGKKIS
jgi:poly(A) polymerase